MDPIRVTTEPPASKPRLIWRLALWISLLYMLFGLIWIVGSDWAVMLLVPPDVQKLSHFQTLKRFRPTGLPR